MPRFLTVLPHALVLVLACTLAGCAAPLATYPPMSGDASLRTIADRADSVHTARAALSIKLTRADGQSIRLDGAMVAALPDRFRVQAWKFGAPVLDLTSIRGDLWSIPINRPGATSEDDALSTVTAEQFARALALFGGDLWRHAIADDHASSPGTLVARLGVSAADTRDGPLCEIDRPTLTPRRLILSPPGGPSPRTLDLTRYRLIDNAIPWATALRFSGPGGSAEVAFEDVELNQPIPDAAFTPPPRARKRP